MSLHAIRRYCSLATVLACITFNAQAGQPVSDTLAEQPASNPQAAQPVSLVQLAHVCTDENETQRLAINEQLREMAKALAEFKPTTFCFIMQPSIAVQLLEQGDSYVKFSHDGKVLYTFPEYIHADNTANVTTGLADNSI